MTDDNRSPQAKQEHADLRARTRERAEQLWDEIHSIKGDRDRFVDHIAAAMERASVAGPLDIPYWHGAKHGDVAGPFRSRCGACLETTDIVVVCGQVERPSESGGNTFAALYLCAACVEKARRRLSETAPVAAQPANVFKFRGREATRTKEDVRAAVEEALVELDRAVAAARAVITDPEADPDTSIVSIVIAVREGTFVVSPSILAHRPDVYLAMGLLDQAKLDLLASIPRNAALRSHDDGSEGA